MSWFDLTKKHYTVIPSRFQVYICSIYIVMGYGPTNCGKTATHGNPNDPNGWWSKCIHRKETHLRWPTLTQLLPTKNPTHYHILHAPQPMHDDFCIFLPCLYNLWCHHLPSTTSTQLSRQFSPPSGRFPSLDLESYPLTRIPRDGSLTLVESPQLGIACNQPGSLGTFRTWQEASENWRVMKHVEIMWLEFS